MSNTSQQVLTARQQSVSLARPPSVAAMNPRFSNSSTQSESEYVPQREYSERKRPRAQTTGSRTQSVAPNRRPVSASAMPPPSHVGPPPNHQAHWETFSKGETFGKGETFSLQECSGQQILSKPLAKSHLTYHQLELLRGHNSVGDSRGASIDGSHWCGDNTSSVLNNRT